MRSLDFIHLHKFIEAIFVLALAFATYSTGFLAFAYDHIFSSVHGTAMQWFTEVMKLFVFSQESQAQGAVLGAQSLFNIIAGVIWMIFFILLFTDIIQKPFDKIIRHKLYPQAVGQMDDNFLIIFFAFILSIFIYSCLIWVGTSLIGNFQLNPFYGTVAMSQTIISGQLGNQIGLALNNTAV